ncbi:MAG: type I toxin-antitoxin system SymE family toxin [Firmicutes bacterium]|nr:type I toxin-antitoxin system SymE family toxin [Bacillota bacterium]
METKVMVVSSRGKTPAIRLSGNWLEKIGFEYGKLVTAEYATGKIILRLEDSDNYKDLVKGALKASSGLFQVSQHFQHYKYFTLIEISGFWMKQLGFVVGSVVAVRYEYGFIKILLIDLEKLEA